MQWIEPEAFGVPKQYINKPMWDLAIKELQKIEICLTPKTKLHAIFNSFKLINSTFSLFSSDTKNESATADDML